MRAPKKPKKIDPEVVAAAESQIVQQTKRIEFYLTDYSVELLADKVRAGDFVVPAYQRAFTWEKERKSKFIESLIMGLPIPFLFFWEMPNGKLEIVDGSQRLRTIEEFVLGDFRVGKLTSLSAMSNFRFADLPESRQRKIRNRPIRGIILNEHADDQARFDMFERINTSSKVANKAEVRRGALGGPFLAMVIALSLDPQFIQLAPVSKKLLAEREHEEFITRFFAYGDGLEGYHDRPADFIFDYVKKSNTAFLTHPELADEYRERFTRTMAFVARVFPYGFRRSATGKATPRARFEAIAIGSYLALVQRPGLFGDQTINVLGWLEDEAFTAVTGSDGANAIARLRDRMTFVRDRLLGAN